MTDRQRELAERLEREFGICDKHIVRIEEALCELKPYFPLNEDTYLHLDSTSIMRLDQFIFRFSKLQDVIGAKLFRYVLEWLYEDVSAMSMRDILNRMERLHFIDDAEKWIYIRELRNAVAHDYPLETKEIVDSLNELTLQFEPLKEIYSRLMEAYRKNS